MVSAACRTARSPSPVPLGISIRRMVYEPKTDLITLMNKLADPRGDVLVPRVDEIVTPPDDKERHAFFFPCVSSHRHRPPSPLTPVSCCRWLYKNLEYTVEDVEVSHSTASGARFTARERRQVQHPPRPPRRRLPASTPPSDLPLSSQLPLPRHSSFPARARVALPQPPSATCSSRLAGQRLEADRGTESSSSDGASKAVRVPLACSEGRRPFNWWPWGRVWGRSCEARCLRLQGCAGARTLLLAEGGRHAGEVEDGIHLCMHRRALREAELRLAHLWMKMMCSLVLPRLPRKSAYLGKGIRKN
ncbi:hypothetical protein BC826DRAFT_575818 [Russula brevipes]|nr:hypothetical protein BC826DRAFT_575818 [Russula brevipes]